MIGLYSIRVSTIMTKDNVEWNDRMKFITFIQWSEHLKKAACLFAGLGQMQPLLLATTNSHYLLDRFCMERCCSSEYVSRIVTSLIFMEILSILVVRIVLYFALRNSNWSSAEDLVTYNKREKPIIDFVSILILCLITLGYIQILLAFIYGGKKGHMHWFYSSLLIQHFLNSLIAGSIGFWEVGRALWYLMAIPMAPIVVFFYQLIIHSLIRNNGPRDAEYIVVEWQIWLALCLSFMATVFWTIGYAIPYKLHISPNNPDKLAELNLSDLNSQLPPSTNIKIYTVTSGTKEIYATSAVKVTIRSITVTLSSGGGTIIRYPNRVVTLGSVDTAETKIKVDTSTSKVTVEIENGAPAEPLLYEGPGTNVTNVKIALEVASSDLSKITSTASGTVEVKGYACYPDPDHGYYISQVNKTTGSPIWNEKWDGGRCFYAEYYERSTSTTVALLMLHVIGNTLNIKYYGNAGSQWKIINSGTFSTKLDELKRTGEFTISGGKDAEDPKLNTNYKKAITEGVWKPWPPSTWKFTPVWAPLLMQGLSVGAVGSIFPNLIPNTLTCARTTRTLSVINMFMVTLPHIFNVMLAENDLLSWKKLPANPWTWYDWNSSLFLYLIYILAILFAIFNIHYPEWRLSTFLRNNTWMVFLMILFTDVLNETFNAISRAGICSQKAAGGEGKKNHPCLHNKIACLMNLTYIPFWLTTTPMMKSYVSSLDPFLCDKDRDHWPTARYGKWISILLCPSLGERHGPLETYQVI